MKQIEINLDRLADISLKGIRRTSVFMSLGITSARDKNIKDYQLSTDTLFRVMPDNLPEDQIEDFKKHFESWIITCGLREMIETFSVYLSGVNKACLFAAKSKGLKASGNMEKKIKSFDWTGVEKQLEILRNSFSVQTSKEKYFKSINQARNCIAHRRGIVGGDDLRGDSQLKIAWWALDTHIETSNGDKILFNPPYPKEGIYIKGGGNVAFTVVDRERQYKIGDFIKLTPTDLSEICLVATLATQEILSSTVSYLKSIGIIVNKTEHVPPADS